MQILSDRLQAHPEVHRFAGVHWAGGLDQKHVKNEYTADMWAGLKQEHPSFWSDHCRQGVWPGDASAANHHMPHCGAEACQMSAHLRWGGS